MLNAKAVATAFLKFRAQEMQSRSKRWCSPRSTSRRSQAQQRLNSINSQIRQLPAQPASSAHSSRTCWKRRPRRKTALSQFQQAAFGSRTGNGSATEAAVKGSVVLDPAIPLAHSRLKPLVLDAAVGLVAGLFLGMAIVVISALVSDRLRRRDDVAQALGAPVRLSVGAVRRRRWLPARGGSAAQDADVQRIAAHLRHAVPRKLRPAPPRWPSFPWMTCRYPRCPWCHWPCRAQGRASRSSWPTCATVPQPPGCSVPRTRESAWPARKTPA